jgi:aryl-alcohol dehydrogenase-like predicted oxidoreductase
MRHHLLGRTGLFVSEICLGTMTFAGRGFWQVVGALPQEGADRLVATSMDAGINFFDTADVYSEGGSEELLGKALGAKRKDVVVATKVRGRTGPGPNETGLSRAHILAAVDASLRRLGTDWIDLYQIHGWDPVTPLDETMRALDDVVRAGKVRYLGCSNLAAWQMMKANGIAAHAHLARFESVQAYYTLAGRDVEREIVPMLADQQMGMLVWSPLAGGLLSGKFARDGAAPAGTRRASFDFPPVNRDRAFDCIDVMTPIAAAHGVSVARVALAWLLARPAVTSVIIGAKDEAQLADNLAAADLTLGAEELAALDAVSALPPEYPGWMIERQSADRVPGAGSAIRAR